MPQVRNMRTASDQAPNGPGSVYSVLTDVSLSLRRRALKVNDTEKMRLSKSLQHLERNVKNDQFRRGQVIGRLNKRLLERRAFHNVLQTNFRANDFCTMSLPYRSKEAFQNDQRYAYETKIYHGGFSQKTLQPEIDRVLHDWDPITVGRVHREKRVKDLKRKNQIFVVDRQKSFTTIFKEHKEHRQLRNRPETDPAEVQRRARERFNIFNDDLDDGAEEEEGVIPRKKALPPIIRSSTPDILQVQEANKVEEEESGEPSLVTQLRRAKHRESHHKQPVKQSKASSRRQSKPEVSVTDRERHAAGSKNQGRASVGSKNQKKLAVGTKIQEKLAVGTKNQERSSVGSKSQEKLPVAAKTQEKSAVNTNNQEKLTIGSKSPEKLAMNARSPEKLAMNARSPEKLAMNARSPDCRSRASSLQVIDESQPSAERKKPVVVLASPMHREASNLAINAAAAERQASNAALKAAAAGGQN